MTTATGYASSSAGPVHFGLGANASADLVEIHWPSRTVQKLANVVGNRVVSITEPRPAGDVEGLGRGLVTGWYT